ncbi:uncharacterized protein LOC144434929 [Glandiceps talaboti]
MLGFGYDDSPFNSLFEELEGDGLFQDIGVKGTPVDKNAVLDTANIFPGLDELEEPLEDWMTEKIDFGQLDAADNFLGQPSDDSELMVLAPLGDSLHKLEVSTSDLELLNSLVVDHNIPPQPPAPEEDIAPNLLALSPSPVSSLPTSRSASPTTVFTIPSPIGTETGELINPIPAATLLSTLVQQSKEDLAVQLPLSQNSPIPSTPISASLQFPLISQQCLTPPVSPSSSTTSFVLSTVTKDKIKDKPKRDPPKRTKSKLKTVGGIRVDKKSRKRAQNKEAATRYREKKREEANARQSVEDVLEKRNKDLREQVDSITREIKYMKDLMADVYKAKGLI